MTTPVEIASTTVNGDITETPNDSNPNRHKRKREEDLQTQDEDSDRAKPKTPRTKNPSNSFVWSPKDDQFLHELVRSTLDLQKVVRVKKFSQKYTSQEIIDRWRALLYDKNISEEATKQVVLLPPLVRRAGLSPTEEEIIKKELSGTQFIGWQAILEKYRPKFHPSRTAKSLEAYYRMKYSGIIEKNRTNKMRAENPPTNVIMGMQNEHPFSTGFTKSNGGSVVGDRRSEVEITSTGTRYVPYSPITTQPASRTQSFPQFEKQIYSTTFPKTEELKPAEKNAIQSRRREYIKQEDQAYAHTTKLERWHEGQKEQVKSPNIIATLRGYTYQYQMQKFEISLGREVQDNPVDVDLFAVIGSSSLPKDQDINKISRKQSSQGLIKFESSDCEFYLHNIGKPPMFVNGKIIPTGTKKRLTHNCLIEVCGVGMMFEINNTWLAQMKTRAGHPHSLVQYPPPTTVPPSPVVLQGAGGGGATTGATTASSAATTPTAVVTDAAPTTVVTDTATVGPLSATGLPAVATRSAQMYSMMSALPGYPNVASSYPVTRMSSPLFYTSPSPVSIHTIPASTKTSTNGSRPLLTPIPTSVPPATTVMPPKLAGNINPLPSVPTLLPPVPTSNPVSNRISSNTMPIPPAPTKLIPTPTLAPMNPVTGTTAGVSTDDVEAGTGMETVVPSPLSMALTSPPGVPVGSPSSTATFPTILQQSAITTETASSEVPLASVESSISVPSPLSVLLPSIPSSVLLPSPLVSLPISVPSPTSVPSPSSIPLPSVVPIPTPSTPLSPTSTDSASSNPTPLTSLLTQTVTELQIQTSISIPTST